MDRATEFIHGFLTHEYDPVKAREYYLRTRELKGRQPGQGENPPSQGLVPPGASEEVRKALEATSERISREAKLISEEAKAKLAAADESHKRAIEGLEKYRVEEKARLSQEAFKKIATLPQVPKGGSKQRRARVAVQRAKAIAMIKGELDAKVKKVDENVDKDLIDGQKEIDDNRQEVLGEAAFKLKQMLSDVKAERERILSTVK